MNFWNRFRLIGSIALLVCGLLALVLALVHEPGEAGDSARPSSKATVQSGTSGL